MHFNFKCLVHFQTYFFKASEDIGRPIAGSLICFYSKITRNKLKLGFFSFVYDLCFV